MVPWKCKSRARTRRANAQDKSNGEKKARWNGRGKWQIKGRNPFQLLSAPLAKSGRHVTVFITGAAAGSQESVRLFVVCDATQFSFCQSTCDVSPAIVKEICLRRQCCVSVCKPLLFPSEQSVLSTECFKLENFVSVTAALSNDSIPARLLNVLWKA